VNWLKNANYLDPALPVIAEIDLPKILRREGQPPEIWGLLAVVLLASLLVETFITYRLISSQKRVDVASAGLPPAHMAA